jgi:hypothetical protein
LKEIKMAGAEQTQPVIERDEFWAPLEHLVELRIDREMGFSKWEAVKADAIRRAGPRAVPNGRRGSFKESLVADEKRVEFRGRYQGKCKIPASVLPEFVDQEFGGFDVPQEGQEFANPGNEIQQAA